MSSPLAPLRGLLTAPHTPFDRFGRVALDRIPPLVNFLIEQAGVDGLYILGSTGEGMSLSGQERRDVAAAFIKSVHGRVPVIVQVGHASAAEGALLAAHAHDVGADAISAVAFSYYPMSNADAAVQMVSEIANGAPNAPFYYYHVPALSGIQLALEPIVERALDRIPSLRGIKYTAPTVDEFQTCTAKYADRLDIVYGRDEMLLSGLVAGARGAVGSTYGMAMPLYRNLFAAFERNDLRAAGQYQQKSIEFINVALAHGGQSAFKTIMSRRSGVDLGPMRSPQHTLTADEAAVMRSELEAIGFFEAT